MSGKTPGQVAAHAYGNTAGAPPARWEAAAQAAVAADRDAWCERAAELTAEVNSLRTLVEEMLEAIRTADYPDFDTQDHWRQRAGLEDEYDGTEDDLMTAEELARDRVDAGLEQP